MKKSLKIVSLALALCLLLALAACGETGDSEKTEPPSASGTSQATGYTFTFKGVEIAVDADLAPIVAALGEPTDYSEFDSCAFQGKDKTWIYGGVILRSYPEGDKDLVLSIELKDDSVSTPEGIYVGSSKDEVTAKYGAPASETDTAVTYVKGGCKLTFILADGKVSSITYQSKVLDA